MRSSSATATTGIAETAPYCGRFAPSPSGPLHFGSLVAAVGSYLDARAADGRWLLRIEDLDPPRARPGAADAILAELERLGFEWDGEVEHQSRRGGHYEVALQRLAAAGLSFRCSCSRGQLAALPRNVQRSGEELFHPAACPAGAADAGDCAIRLQVADGLIAFVDRAQGPVHCNVAQELGPFVLRRRDGLASYQLAVVVDDALQGVSHVVRGADLLGSTARQILLQRALGLATPAYLHLPLAVAADGTKLSKSADEPAPTDAPAQLLQSVLQFLRQDPPQDLPHWTLHEVWAWAVANWRPGRFAGERQRACAPTGTMAYSRES